MSDPTTRPDDDFALNEAWWNERAGIHPNTPLYQDMYAALRSGGDCLNKIECEEVGSVEGKSLLHVQCHVGTDTLSWARRGAAATGVDFSAEALKEGRRLGTELAIPAQFVHSNVYDLPENLDGEFDVVFSSYGAICWLHDLTRWAEVIAQFVKPGGFFYLVEVHPLGSALDENAMADGDELKLKYPYFGGGEPLRWDEPGTYADQDAKTQHDKAVEWPHHLGEILSALIEAGLQIELFREHRSTVYQAFPNCTKQADRTYLLPENVRDRVPLLFSVKARKPA